MMQLAVMDAGKWGLTIMGRYLNKVQITTLPLGRLKQSAHATACIDKGVEICK